MTEQFESHSVTNSSISAHQKVIRTDIVLVREVDILASKRQLDLLPYYLHYELVFPDGHSTPLTLTRRCELSPANVKVTFHTKEMQDLDYIPLDVSSGVKCMRHL